jgi:hypothetical protein
MTVRMRRTLRREGGDVNPDAENEMPLRALKEARGMRGDRAVETLVLLTPVEPRAPREDCSADGRRLLVSKIRLEWSNLSNMHVERS